MRRVITFPCAGETLVGTVDDGANDTGLLIVSGGNEIRIGAHRGMARLAATLATRGTPVFRYDRRGIGDSTGDNIGFAGSADDMAAAAAAFRAHAPHVTRLVGFGNCDAATALALFHAHAEIDALVLANPWTIEEADGLPPAAAIRARYDARLKDARTYLRLINGGINLGKLLSGLRKISDTTSENRSSLATRLGSALNSTAKPVEIVLAKSDATAIAFSAACHTTLHTHTLDTASHSFARRDDQAALEAILSAALS